MAEQRKGKESLQAREYRDEEGNIHHHTKEYMHRKGKDSEQSGGSDERGRRDEEQE